MSNVKETLSSNTLFHFTKSREILTLILTNEFSPRYCLEDLTMLGITEADKISMELGVPMVCFCDIPLSKIRFHLSCYGNYGIGMKKSWDIKNKVTPVVYASPKSETTSIIKEMLKIVRHKENNKTPYVHELRIYLSSLLRFIKPYKGDFTHNGKKHKNRVYYNEREWRYVPTIDKLIYDKRPFLEKEEFLNETMRSQANESLRITFTLSFIPDDIEYIIVKNKTEIPLIINDIMSIKHNYDDDTKRLLISKIISCENISNDF